MDMYTDIERSIYTKLTQAVTAAGLSYPVYNNQVSKADFKNSHASISIMKISDVFNPANGGGEHAVLRTAVKPDPNQPPVSSYILKDWPDPFDLVYTLTVEAETAMIGGSKVSGLEHVRKCDQLIRDTFRPRKRMLLWDSTANNGQGGWSTNYVNYVWAGYINRDVAAEEMYNRVTNIRFECFNYSSVTTTEPAITSVPTLELDPSIQS